MCTSSIQQEQELRLHSRNGDKDVRRSGSLKGTKDVPWGPGARGKAKEGGLHRDLQIPPKCQGPEEIRGVSYRP